MESQPTIKPRREDHHDLRHRAESQIQLSGFRPLRRSGSRHHRRCRSHAARTDRSREDADHPRSPPRDPGTRREGRAKPSRDGAQQHRELAAVGWDASPISTARLSAELWAQIKNEDWSLVSNDRMVSSWPTRLWNFNKHYQYIGAQGGAGIGYGAPAAVGAALANRKHGRLTVNIQMRRRSELRSRRAVDRRASPDPAC